MHNKQPTAAETYSNRGIDKQLFEIQSSPQARGKGASNSSNSALYKRQLVAQQ